MEQLDIIFDVGPGGIEEQHARYLGRRVQEFLAKLLDADFGGYVMQADEDEAPDYVVLTITGE